MKTRLLATAALLSSTLWLASCGGDDNSSPTPTPTSTPTPSPTPTPTPTPTGPPPETDANLAGANINGVLNALLNCSGKPVRNEAGLLANITESTDTTVKIAKILYKAADTFDVSVESATAVNFTPANRVSASDHALTWLASGAKQLDFIRKDRFAAPSVTLGTYSDTTVCVFAAGLAPSNVPTTGTKTYYGYADGLARGTTSQRLLLISHGTVALDAANKKATVQMQFATLADPQEKGPFLDLTGRQSVQLISGTATLTQEGATLKAGTFTGTNGYAGTIYGSFIGASGIILPFELHTSTGERIWGVIAADSALTS
ncbi:hypothetical protein [Novosphingobium album (ex Liu et al. 2023)]|uniref:Transferrin-binding protein B C-lobe/N-lobe beta barrel domain-containing protein n=1 Tax=Novosphingobium album (ex Liu et al. 2023) TaxID=3031130 RepID=A0ABT5WPF5_9SPHN|nr:hypothetical protein [Novosphingobium album (ex Liu et al. 2023)]MDE8651162.1 hypothetical protein [Novosphingobium album (ex Liu et al. 2023)]